jgi:hypothetical protein
LLDDVILKLDHSLQGTKIYYENHDEDKHKLMLNHENNLTEKMKELFTEMATIKSELVKNTEKKNMPNKV